MALERQLISSPDPRFDISQIVAGGQYSTYAAALAAVGTYPVESISLVVDSGWAFDDKEQTVLARNITVNSDVFYVYPAPTTTGGMNPAKACAALRTQMGAEAFKLKYGTNANKANAFGKCVSSMARMKNDAARHPGGQGDRQGRQGVREVAWQGEAGASASTTHCASASSRPAPRTTRRGSVRHAAAASPHRVRR